MGFEINFDTKIQIQIENCNFKEITIQFLFVLRSIFESYVSKILDHYFTTYYESGELAQILKVKKVLKKSDKNKTKFKTIFGVIRVPQIQVRVVDFQGKKYQMTITRQLLGVSRKFQIPDFMKEIIGWIGSVTTYRVGLEIIKVLTNFKCSLMSLWNSVQFSAPKIRLNLSDIGTNEFEADGTGIPTKGTGKRGSELKKVFQRKTDGKLQLIGLSIGKYKDIENWNIALKAPIVEGLMKFKTVVLASDGDLSITGTAKKISEYVKIQKDKWHVFYQMKYYLWLDKVVKEVKNEVISSFYKLTMLSKSSIEERTNFIKEYINSLKNKGYNHSATYLESAIDGFYTHESEGNKNVYTSQTERSMRTTNQRINVGVWSETGAFNVAKIRLSHYYNDINPLSWKNVT